LCYKLPSETDLVGFNTDKNSYIYQTIKFCEKHNIQYSSNCRWMDGDPFFPHPKMLTVELEDRCYAKIETLRKNNPSKKIIIIEKENDRCVNPNYYDKTRVCKNWCMKKGNLDYYYCGKKGYLTEQQARNKVEKAQCTRNKGNNNLTKFNC